MNSQEKADLYLLARNVRLRYDLDALEGDALDRLLKGYDAARRYLVRQINSLGPDMEGSYTKDRALATLDHVYEMTAGVRQELGRGIGDLAAEAGEVAFKTHNDIVSFGGKAAGFRAVELSREQIRSLIVDTPIGGRNLAGWVDRTFDEQLRERIRAEIVEGAILGQGYPAIVKRLEQGFSLAKRDSITLARTYVQNVNTSAQEAVYKANKDIVRAVEWTATLEPGYKKTGRGTCLRCASLDGRRWPLDKPHPPAPLHPRCRCLLVPVCKSWRDLGIDIDEFENEVRPWTDRPDKNIDAGGRRTVLEHGFHGGDYGSWFRGQSQAFQKNVLGPGRYALWKDGRLNWNDLTDDWGNMRTLKELESGRFRRRGGSEGGGPTPGPATD